jgi:hypothetical protein
MTLIILDVTGKDRHTFINSNGDLISFYKIIKDGNTYHSTSYEKIIPIYDDFFSTVITSSGTKKWFKNGKLHRNHNLPAIVFWLKKKDKYYNNGIEYFPNIPQIYPKYTPNIPQRWINIIYPQKRIL